MRTWLIVALIALTSFAGKAQTDVAPAQLAFVLIDPAAEALGEPERIYLYDAESRALRHMGIGDNIKWSPNGRYLGMLDTINHGLAAMDGNIAGRLHVFSTHDFETNITHTWEFLRGQAVAWSPDARFMINYGSIICCSCVMKACAA